MTDDLNEHMRQRAITLNKAGYTPILLNGKIPVIRGWQKSSTTPQAIQGWDFRGHNLGLRTGDKGLVVLDFDGQAGYDLFIKGFPELLNTHTVQTGSGNGVHLYLTIQGELPRSSGVI